MIGCYLMDHHYEPRIDLGKFRGGILAPIEVKSQNTTFDLDFKPTQEEI